MNHRHLLAAGLCVLAIGLGLSCEGPPGPQGPIGPPGTIPVSATPPFTCSAAGTGKLYVSTAAGTPRLEVCDGARWTPFGGDPDCPAGYRRDAAEMNIVLCKKGVDEVVKVGSGAAAFWIDRYEASVWQNPDGSGQQYGLMLGDYPATFPRNGQWKTPLYAVSKAGIMPSSSITWFQSNEACRASGKRLPHGDEWLAAARGTAADGGCLTSGGSVRPTGQGARCVSEWGAQDMIGNLWEQTAEWFAGVGQLDTSATPWGTEIAPGDKTFNIMSKAYGPDGGAVAGLPSIGLRGGDTVQGGAGVFAINLNVSPVHRFTNHGFRCVIPP
jgi:hypothetical protein